MTITASRPLRRYPTPQAAPHRTTQSSLLIERWTCGTGTSIAALVHDTSDRRMLTLVAYHRDQMTQWADAPVRALRGIVSRPLWGAVHVDMTDGSGRCIEWDRSAVAIVCETGDIVVARVEAPQSWVTGILQDLEAIR